MVILANASTHHTMEVVLPEIGPNLLHDRSPIVRAAFANLLDVIASCRAIPTQHVVPHEELYMSLASEHAQSVAEWTEREAAQLVEKRGAHGSTDVVAQGLTKLMAPSLFGETIAEQVQRCHELLLNFPLALLALLSNAVVVVPVADRVKLAVALFTQGRKQLDRTLDGQPQGAVKEPFATVLLAAGV